MKFVEQPVNCIGGSGGILRLENLKKRRSEMPFSGAKLKNLDNKNIGKKVEMTPIIIEA